MEASKIIICPQSLNKIFLSLKNKNPYLDITLFSLNELQKDLFGSVSNSAYKVLLTKTKFDLKTLKEIVALISRGIDVESHIDIKTVYTTLCDNNLIKFNKIIKQLFVNKEVEIYGYQSTNIELIHVLKELGCDNYSFHKLEEIIAEKETKILEFKTLDEEIRYTLTKIIDEDNKALQNNTKIMQKLIICNTNEYEGFMKYFANAYGVHLNFIDGEKISQTDLGKYILNQAKNNNDILNILLAKMSLLDEKENTICVQIINIIKEYLCIKRSEDNPQSSNSYVDNLFINLKYLLDSTYVVGQKFENEIMVSSSADFNPNIECYLLGASDVAFPSLKKNNCMYDDSFFVKNYINSSTIENNEIELLAEKFIKMPNVVQVSYFKMKGKDKVYPTNLISGDNVVIPKNIYIDYSENVAKAYLSKAIDIKKKYNEDTFDLNYLSLVQEEQKYDSSFSGIKPIDFKTISLSYTSMSNLFSCPFKFYLEYLLDLNEFEETFYTLLGKFVHKLFEMGEKYQFEKAYEIAYQELNLDAKLGDKDKLILSSEKSRIKEGYEYLRASIYAKNKSVNEHEYKKTYNVRENDKTLTVNGSIDNFVVLYPSNTIVIIDYKTGYYSLGDEVSNEAGLNLQLPFYSYMLGKDSDYSKYNISGIYFAPLIPKILNKNSKEYKDFYKLDGLTFISGQIDPAYLSKGSLKTETKTIDEYRKLVDKKVKEAETIIKSSKFNILPYKDKKQCACDYCEYKNICFRFNASENKYRDVREEDEDGDE